MRYEAGENSEQRFSIKVENTNFMTPLAIETWCIESCDGTYSIIADDKKTVLSFGDNQDAVLFKMSRYSADILR